MHQLSREPRAGACMLTMMSKQTPVYLAAVGCARIIMRIPAMLPTRGPICGFKGEVCLSDMGFQGPNGVSSKLTMCHVVSFRFPADHPNTRVACSREQNGNVSGNCERWIGCRVHARCNQKRRQGLATVGGRIIDVFSLASEDSVLGEVSTYHVCCQLVFRHGAQD